MGGPRTTFEFTKICAKCRRERPHSAFPSAGVRGLDSYCTSCSAIVKRERYRKNPAPYLKNARRQNAKLKGIIYLTPDYSSGSYLLMQRAIPPQPRGGCYAR